MIELENYAQNCHKRLLNLEKRGAESFNPNQPRGSDGKWVRDGSSGSSNTIVAQAEIPHTPPKPGQIDGFTKHGINQTINRGVTPEAMNDAVKNPTKTVPRDNGTTQYRGKRATVVLDAWNRVISSWRKSSKKSYDFMYYKSHKQLHSFLRSFLLTEWDPIGVGQEPEAQDEYDAYINGLIPLLTNNANINALADYLYTIETSQMGLVSDYKKLHIIAQKLNAIMSKT